MLDPSDYQIISWTQYQELTSNLAEKILPVRKDLDRIIGIARSGLTLGHILSDLLQLPVSVFGAKSYIEFGKQGKMKITQDITINLSQERILLVDSIAETGKTLDFAVKYIGELNTQKITTATLFYNPLKSFVKPDFYAAEFKDKTIVMPHELIEFTLEQCEGKSDEEIAQIQQAFRIPDSQIEYVKRLL